VPGATAKIKTIAYENIKISFVESSIKKPEALATLPAVIPDDREYVGYLTQNCSLLTSIFHVQKPNSSKVWNY
jgi:hypothetical protein